MAKMNSRLTKIDQVEFKKMIDQWLAREHGIDPGVNFQLTVVGSDGYGTYTISRRLRAEVRYKEKAVE